MKGEAAYTHSQTFGYPSSTTTLRFLNLPNSVNSSSSPTQMPILTASIPGSSLVFPPAGDCSAFPRRLVTSFSAALAPNNFPPFLRNVLPRKGRSVFVPKCTVSNGSTGTQAVAEESTDDPDFQDLNDVVRARRSADWKAARAYKERGIIYRGRVEGSNGGGLLVRFYSLVGFLPFPQLSPSHSCKEPEKSIQEIATNLIDSIISVKVIQADEDSRKLIFSEKEAIWSKFSQKINLGDTFDARVGNIEDYGAFVHLRFPDGVHYITGLVHVSEVSWDLIQDIRDVLREGDNVRVKIVNIDREKSRISLSIKQLEEDPLLETLEKVIPQNGLLGPDFGTMEEDYNIDPLPGLQTIIEELLREDGIRDVIISRQGFEKRVVSPDLQLWLSNTTAAEDQFTLLARAGRQVQELTLTTSLDQEGIKKALQRVLERVP